MASVPDGQTGTKAQGQSDGVQPSGGGTVEAGLARASATHDALSEVRPHLEGEVDASIALTEVKRTAQSSPMCTCAHYGQERHVQTDRV